MGQHDALRHDETADEVERDTPPHGRRLDAHEQALNRVVTGWARRGYAVRYRDPYLVQLVRRERPSWRGWSVVALAVGVAAAASVVMIARARKWHVVTLVIRSDGRIMMHQQRSPREPAP